MRRSGFTLIELIFVIVIIGVLAATAIPKFKNLKTNAGISNIVKPIATLLENGEAAFLNETELNEVAATDLQITDIMKVQGKGWSITDANQTARYDSNDGNATFQLQATATPPRVLVTLLGDFANTHQTKIESKTGVDFDNTDHNATIDLASE